MKNGKLNNELKKISLVLSIALALLYVITAVTALPDNKPRGPGTDIGATYLEGERICKGINPYSRIIEQGDDGIRKPPTYFPGFYVSVCALNRLGIKDFNTFRPVWTGINAVLCFLLGAAFWYALWKRQLYLEAVFAPVLLFYGRWSSNELFGLMIDIPGVLPLVLSILLFDRHRRASYVMFGLSLAMKQIGIFIAPLFLIWAYVDRGDRKPLHAVLECIVLCSLLPAIMLAPFMYNDLKGTVLSILHSAVRRSGRVTHYWLLKDIPFSATFMLFFSMLIVYALAFFQRLPRGTAAFLVMICFISFNRIYFPQYSFWPVALVPFVLLEYAKKPE